MNPSAQSSPTRRRRRRLSPAARSAATCSIPVRRPRRSSTTSCTCWSPSATWPSRCSSWWWRSSSSVAWCSPSPAGAARSAPTWRPSPPGPKWNRPGQSPPKAPTGSRYSRCWPASRRRRRRRGGGPHDRPPGPQHGRPRRNTGNAAAPERHHRVGHREPGRDRVKPVGRGIHALTAELYSASLASEIAKGMSQKAKIGGWPHAAPLGYTNVRGMMSGRQVAHSQPRR